jgi:hypothetical protein
MHTRWEGLFRRRLRILVPPLCKNNALRGGADDVGRAVQAARKLEPRYSARARLALSVPAPRREREGRPMFMDPYRLRSRMRLNSRWGRS